MNNLEQNPQTSNLEQTPPLKQTSVSGSYSLVGKKFRTIDGYRCHVVNIFTDEREEVITYKKWSKRKQRWYHFSDYLELFMVQFDYGAKWL